MKMCELTLRKEGITAFQITGCNTLTGRQMTKLNIYLNALNDISFESKPDFISINYKQCDELLIGKSIRNLVCFLGNQSININIDENIKYIVNEIETHQANSIVLVSKLHDIKMQKNDFSHEYTKFCIECDDFLKIDLRDYQYKAAYLFFLGKGGFDFSVPGAGKTIITYTAYKQLIQNGYIERMFIIGPISSYNAWFDEFYTCFGYAPAFENLADQTANDCKLYLNSSKQYHSEITFVNIDKVRLISSEIKNYLTKSSVLLVIDEGHKIKNPEAEATKSILNFAKYAKCRIILTGTPMPNGYEDLFSLAKTLNPFEDILPYSYNQLRKMTQNGASQKLVSKLRESIFPYYSRVSKKHLIDNGDLLEPIFQSVICEMDTYQKQLYERLNDFFGKMNEHVDEDLLTLLKKAILIRKMQISANPALLKLSIVKSMDEINSEYLESFGKEDTAVERLIKIDNDLMDKFSDSEILKIINKYDRKVLITMKNKRVLELTRELIRENKKVLIWDVFVNNMNVIKELLEETLTISIEIINGSVTGINRRNSLMRFREGSSMVLIANPATLAESISLHRVCQHAIYVNMNFNAAQYMQSKDRIHRINMPLGTIAKYYFIMNEATVDLCVMERLVKKENRMLSILDVEELEIGGAELEDSSIMSIADIEESYLR